VVHWCWRLHQPPWHVWLPTLDTCWIQEACWASAWRVTDTSQTLYDGWPDININRLPCWLTVDHVRSLAVVFWWLWSSVIMSCIRYCQYCVSTKDSFTVFVNLSHICFSQCNGLTQCIVLCLLSLVVCRVRWLKYDRFYMIILVVPLSVGLFWFFVDPPRNFD